MQGLARDILTAQRDNIEGKPLDFLEVSEQYWKVLRNMKSEPERKGPKVVTTQTTNVGPCEFDLIICGGTLGLFLATALQMRGKRVCIVEKRLCVGRNQEWNISRGEISILTELGLLSQEELEKCIISEFNPIRCGFKGGKDIWIEDVLNLGILPRVLLEMLRAKFEAAGGVIYENTAFKSAKVGPDGILVGLAPGGRDATLSVGDTNRPNGMGEDFRDKVAAAAAAAEAKKAAAAAPRQLRTRLLLDCMGHYSDIVKQIRGRVKPDGMCMVVGSCAEGEGFPSNTSADLLYSVTHALEDMQLFWEAFPAEGGTARTTYMFAYSDAKPERPSFESLLDTYFEQLPAYQGLGEGGASALRYKRVLFGGFPCYSNGPLAPAFDRIMQIGDASCAQSPLSFGGFGSMVRHIGRLTRALNQALDENRLTKEDLGWVQPYQPSLSASWLFQRAMSVSVGQATYPPLEKTKKPQQQQLTSYGNQSFRRDLSSVPTTAFAVAGGGGRTMSMDGNDRSSSSSNSSGNGSSPANSGGNGNGAGAAYSTAFSTNAAGNVSMSSLSSMDQVGGAYASIDLASSVGANGRPMRRPARPLLPRSSLTRSQQKARFADWALVPHTQVNQVLATNFGVMRILGDRVIRPFLQDTIQLVPLSLSMTGMLIANPIVIGRVLLQVGPQAIGYWFAHYIGLVVYTLGFLMLKPFRGVFPSFGFQRLLDALEYGSGQDYHYHPPGQSPKRLGPAPGPLGNKPLSTVVEADAVLPPEKSKQAV